MKTKRIMAAALAAMLTATAFAGCTGGGDTSSTASESTASQTSSSGVSGSIVDESLFGEEDNVTLKVWAPDKAVSLVKEQIETFKAAYPNKTFNIEVVAQGESDAATQILNDATTAADVFAFPSDQLNKLVNADVLAQVAPAFVDAVTEQNDEEAVASGTINGTLYCYPETKDNGYYLVYDKSVVSDEQAKTLEGVLAACKDAGKQFIMDCGNGFYSCTFAFTAGAKIDGIETEEVDGETEEIQKFTEYDEDEAVATLCAFAQLMKDYKGTFDSQDVKKVASGFSNGTLGAGVDGTWDTDANKTALGDNFGAAKLPTINVNGTDKQLISMFGYKYIGVNGSSQYPNTSQILAYYLSGEECQLQRAEQLAWGPSNKTVLQSEVVTNDVALSAVMEQAANACVQVNIVNAFWSPMGTLGDSLFSDSCDPTDTAAMKELLEKTINSING